MYHAFLTSLQDHPFKRLNNLLKDISPSKPDNISMVAGEPNLAPPKGIFEIIAQNAMLFNKYPNLAGTSHLRSAFISWLHSRFKLDNLQEHLQNNILPICGSKEGLFTAGAVLSHVCEHKKNLVLIPNPYYQVYKGACILNNKIPYFLDAMQENGFQPDITNLPSDTLNKVSFAYICNPSNPQGGTADLQKIMDTITLAREHNFYLIFDECYSETYNTKNPPFGALDAINQLNGKLDNVLVSFTLSKRSSVAGLRSGFMVGDQKIVDTMMKYRAYASPVMPIPIDLASAYLWEEKEHVIENRKFYQQNFINAEQILHNYNYHKPKGGLYLWLPCKNGLQLTKTLYKEENISVLPGQYLTESINGINRGENFIRLAMTKPHDITKSTLKKITKYL